MLIIPLHRKLTPETFPWVTFALILANFFVYVALQSRDAGVGERAAAYFRSSGLAAVELPRYREHLQATGQAELLARLDRVPEPYQPEAALSVMQEDAAFQAALAAAPPILPEGSAGGDWGTAHARLQSIWQERFTERWMTQFRQYDPVTVFTSMFLHANAGHLIGNMLFLALLGLLVEGALGPALFLALYLLAGFLGGTMSALRHAGEVGGGLGASGAIAGLMGAYCVLWGRRKVRFFWWFFVAFDYVKAPALVLLPAWLGWETLNLMLNAHSNVAFDVHAGGIVAGALLALAVKQLRWERREFLDEETKQDEAADLLRTGLTHLGKLEFTRARTALVELARRRPDDLEVRVAVFRAWRDRVQDPAFHEAARSVLRHPAPRREDQALVQRVLVEYLEASGTAPRLLAEDLLPLAKRWCASGALAEATRALELVERLPGESAGAPEAMLALALALTERNQADAGRRWLQRLAQRYPDSPASRKAALLLAQ